MSQDDVARWESASASACADPDLLRSDVLPMPVGSVVLSHRVQGRDRGDAVSMCMKGTHTAHESDW